MHISIFEHSEAQKVIQLFNNVFTHAEGAEEGQQISTLVVDLIAKTKPADLLGFVAKSEGALIGSIFFSRLEIDGVKNAFILSPVAVATCEQNKGVGQKLINYGIAHLASRSVDWVFTYGDPNYYGKFGFKAISESSVKAPFQLTQPEGWLAQSLSGSVMNGSGVTAHCVGAFNNQKYW